MKWRRTSGHDRRERGQHLPGGRSTPACDLLHLAFHFTADDLREYKDAQGIEPTSAIPQSKFRPFMRHHVMEHGLPLRLDAATNNIATRSANGVVCGAISATDDEGLYLLITTESDTTSTSSTRSTGPNINSNVFAATFPSVRRGKQAKTQKA
ncbi:hypothetical protein H310_10197 [Aphanomyces invadans]|uniref:Uncharacterized protein n=1 Tax=Aphanomyces invadans TaxID=157072 RepID=A0A024TQP0_9STRA|nr:hypothetical protein H310_10197 [Aphanomyces invadans]ETV96445.1 hypothetical protein H310_10197 [Aphanomyces invadans]|eukprot:XP_008874708.1 hypothetical protein H310_10197 [Aphanomyces invadans]